MLRQEIIRQWTHAHERALSQGRLQRPLTGPVALAFPRDPRHGDCASNLALSLASQGGPEAGAIAQVLIEHLPEGDLFEAVKAAPSGFLNMALSTDALKRELGRLLAETPLDGSQGDEAFLEALEADFSPERAMAQSHEPPNPFARYMLARTRSLLALASAQGLSLAADDLGNFARALCVQQEERPLLLQLALAPADTHASAQALPYAHFLAGAFQRFYRRCRVFAEEAHYPRLALVAGTCRVLESLLRGENGLERV